MEPISDHTAYYETLDDMSHALDGILLGGPRRVITTAPMITNLWSGMAEDVYKDWLQYTNAESDVAQSIVAFEFHSTTRVRPVSTRTSLNRPTKADSNPAI